MKIYVKTFLISGVAIPIVLHMLAGGTTPWWPDTVSLWNALKTLGRLG